MPPSFTPEQITKIKLAIPHPNHKILAAAPSKLYIAYPNPHQWTYTGLSGAIILTKDITQQTYFFKLVDVLGAGGQILWDFELWKGFVYVLDTPWFQSFEMDGFMGGLSFVDDGDGRRFYKKVLGVIGESHGGIFFWVKMFILTM
jgi:neural Wiskott-Aldrich syndrome protein